MNIAAKVLFINPADMKFCGVGCSRNARRSERQCTAKHATEPHVPGGVSAIRASSVCFNRSFLRVSNGSNGLEGFDWRLLPILW